MVPSVTLLDLVTTVSGYARTEAEVVATVVAMVNGGTVRLGGSFRGARFDLSALDGPWKTAGIRTTKADASLDAGARIRSTRPITHARGTLCRASEGTVRSRRQNVGRELVTVDFDSGERLVLFPHEIEPVTGLAA